MKYITLITFLLTAMLSAYGQQSSKYEIFKVVGDVTFTTTGAAAKPIDVQAISVLLNRDQQPAKGKNNATIKVSSKISR